jgi:hypothetical protein
VSAAAGLASAERDPLDADELLIWTIMRTFEVQASAQYVAHVPQLATPEKRRVGPALLDLAGDDGPLEASTLGASMKALVASASEAAHEGAVLVVQGLILERVRQVVYATLERVERISERSRAIARSLEGVSRTTVARAPELFAAAYARQGQAPFALFTEASDDVLGRLDAVGEGVDEVFGDRFDLRFAEIVGDFVAELVPACVRLGMERRKVMSHLAGALMGI